MNLKEKKMKGEKEVKKEKERIEEMLSPEEGSSFSELHLSSSLKGRLFIKLQLINWILEENGNK